MAPETRARTSSVDLLRGLVMVLMALDHARDYFTSFRTDATDLATTTPALFFTRFVTHFCAPVFVFLAGTGAYLSRAGGKPVAELSRFLWTRGVWLVVLELTIVRFCWMFDVSYRFSVLQVIWAIGWSMVALSVFVRARVEATAAIGGAMVILHNAFDGVHSSALGGWGWLWRIVHEQTFAWEPVAGHRVAVVYPLVPWIGVMALGYACGAWLVLPGPARRRALARAGIAAIVAFVVLRASNLYGDPHPWSAQKNAIFTALSFLNVEKYPPSLCFVLVTLGPALVFLAAFDEARGPVAQALTVYGRVPLFYYVLHIFLIHAAASAVSALRGHTLPFASSESLGWPLAGVYAVWIAVVAALYVPCRWYGAVKVGAASPRARAILSYL